MRVKNRKCIRRLSFKSLWASRKRNIIAICAIALTTLMFTSLFTIMMSVNSSYETYNFRQAGGYSDGIFKDLSREQTDKIAAHKGIKASGERIVCGFSSSDVFGKVAAEVSYMDKNCTKWSYATPTTGKEPQKENEIAMDTTALRLLGVEPKLGTNVTITYQAGNGTDTGIPQTDSFILVGYWEYDDLMPVHYINVSKAYVDKINEKCIAAGDEALDIDLNVMLPSKFNIREQMEKIDTDLGYDWNTRDQENSARIGVNWGLTASSVSSDIDFSLVAAILAFFLLIIFTGYLIIYNIFQISVTGDIRFYGLLKTIGTTPRQLKHIITQEALFLCIIGIPVGLLLGYGIGAVLTPIALETTSIIGTKAAISSSPLIFIGSAVFAIITVFLSCRKPGKMAAKVSPVEAAKYTEGMTGKKKKRHSRGAKVYQMAFANLGRNKKKTILVVVSLTLSVTLLNVLFSLVNGFDMDKYVDRSTCADFIVSSTDYFRYNTADEYIGADTIDEIKKNTDETVSGSGYDLADISPMMWMETDQYSKLAENYLSGKELQEEISHYEQKGDSILVDVSIEGFDDGLFDKLTVVKGSLEPLSDPDSHAIAVAVSTDDYGNIVNLDNYPELGDTYTVNYQIGYDIDSRTGERADQQTTPEEYLEYHEEEAKEVEYSVCAFVTVPDSISFRYTSLGYSMVLPVEKLKEDSGTDVIPKFYMFDTPDSQAEASAEQYLQKLTAGDTSTLMYESKASIRREFTRFKNMFLICGGALCAIIGLVGILNFFNAIMTGILSRKREFAVLQSVGMTKRQLKLMLIYEGFDDNTLLSQKRTLKTRNSKRYVPLPDFIMDELYLARARYEETLKNDPEFDENLDFVLFRDHGKAIARPYYYFKKLMKKCNIDCTKHVWHDLRHTYATLLDQNNMNMKVVSEILGHYSEEFTNEVYVIHKPEVIIYDTSEVMNSFIESLKLDSTERTIPVYDISFIQEYLF